MMHALAIEGGETFVVRAGAVAAALVTLTMAIRMMTKFIVKQLTKAIHSELGGKVEKVYENTLELKPNGGSSLKDAVNRLEVRQLQVQAELQAQREALTDHLADHRKVD